MQERVGSGESEALIEWEGALTRMHDEVADGTRACFLDHRLDQGSTDPAIAQIVEHIHALHIAGEADEIAGLRNSIENGQPCHAGGFATDLGDVGRVAVPAPSPPLREGGLER